MNEPHCLDVYEGATSLVAARCSVVECTLLLCHRTEVQLWYQLNLQCPELDVKDARQ